MVAAFPTHYAGRVTTSSNLVVFSVIFALAVGAAGEKGRPVLAFCEALVDVMFSEHRDMAAAKAFFQSAKTVTDVTPDRVTTDGHDSYPRAIRTTLGKTVRHRTSRYLNNRLEQDHRGIKGRYQPMRGFKCPRSAGRFCRGYDELRSLLRPRARPHQHMSANKRRLCFLRRTATVMAILEAA